MAGQASAHGPAPALAGADWRDGGHHGIVGLAWHQWRKHGVCSGLSSEDYYALSRLAYERVVRPDLLRRLDREVRLPARVIEEAFLEANPALSPTC
jgi:ribonuclease T2